MEEVKKQLRQFLTTGQAHMTFAEAVKDFPLDKINEYPPNVDYSPWDLLEHIRRTQYDLLEFMTAEKYSKKTWPEDYWPEKEKKATSADWQKTVDLYNDDTKAIAGLLKTCDLSAKVSNGDTQTYIREILLAIDHTAYHIGEFAILRQVMGTWQKNHEV